MANEEQLSILRRGVEAWNGWRAKNIYVYADFNEADLSGVDLSGIDLRIAHLRRANLFRADLSGADLSGADLSDADFREANLREANLTRANLNGAGLRSAFAREANLSQANLLAANLRNANCSHADFGDANLMVANLGGADLSGANLSKANLTKARLAGVNLRQADLSGARLTRANLTKSSLLEARFIGTDLNGTNLSEIKVGATVFANSDLSNAIGLDSVDHQGPSHSSLDTFILSAGKIPEIFLRGCGLSDWEIEQVKLYNPALSNEEIQKLLQRVNDLRAKQAPQISPLFISYSHADSPFVDKVENQLNRKGIRFWRDIHDLKAGRIEKQTDGVVRQNPTVLLILSKNSCQSDWVRYEIGAARELQKNGERGVLCPIALDESWKESQLPEQIPPDNIFDFSAWKTDSRFHEMFHTLIDGLELYYKG